MSLICAGLIYLFNFMSFENYLVSELFKKENDEDDGKDDKKGSVKTKAQTKENDAEDANEGSE